MIPRKRAPWADFNGIPLYEGDTISHPSGEKGVVVYKEPPMCKHFTVSDLWFVDYGDGVLSRLCLQLGDKGQAIKENK